jgi:hypothetical protein
MVAVVTSSFKSWLGLKKNQVSRGRHGGCCDQPIQVLAGTQEESGE